MLRRRARGTLGLRWVGSGEGPAAPPAGSTYYVAADGDATDAQATYNAAVDVDTPCAPAVAFKYAVAGDTVQFRGGTYSVPAKTTGDTYSGYYAPTNSGSEGSPITFMAYPTETPVFDGTVTGQSAQNYFGTNGNIGERIFGVGANHHYIVFDGFTIQCDGGDTMGSMIIWGGTSTLIPPYTTTHITVKNCTFNGGTGTGNWTDNSEGLRIEKADSVTVQRCTFYNYRSTATNPYNVSALKTYSVTNTTVERCEVYDCSGALYDKSKSDGDIYRYNFVHDCSHGIYFTAASATASAVNGQVYGNLVLRCTATSIQTDDSYARPESLTGWEVHHNTCYQAAACSGGMVNLAYVGLIEVHSNIVAGAGTGGYGQMRFYGTVGECDYHCYDDNGLKFVKNFSGYYTLADWQALTFVNGTDHPDLNSVASDPLFVNTSGNLNQIADFALQAGSPCKGAGKAGTDMGCNVSNVGVSGAD